MKASPRPTPRIDMGPDVAAPGDGEVRFTLTKDGPGECRVLVRTAEASPELDLDLTDIVPSTVRFDDGDRRKTFVVPVEAPQGAGRGAGFTLLIEHGSEQGCTVGRRAARAVLRAEPVPPRGAADGPGAAAPRPATKRGGGPRGRPWEPRNGR